jgi:hypothetical protein
MADPLINKSYAYRNALTRVPPSAAGWISFVALTGTELKESHFFYRRR